MLRPITLFIFLAFLWLANAGCSGVLDDMSAPNSPGTSEITTSFSLARTPTLLAFDIRLRRLANTLSIKTSDPALEPLRASKLALGDYDYASSVNADGLWLATRMNAWVRALIPVCNSQTMHDKYPALPDGFATLAETAWGRHIDESEVAELKQDITDSGVNAEQAYLTTCISVFSAAEFIFR